VERIDKISKELRIQKSEYRIEKSEEVKTYWILNYLLLNSNKNAAHGWKLEANLYTLEILTFSFELWAQRFGVLLQILNKIFDN
jgi:hypothetical protein